MKRAAQSIAANHALSKPNVLAAAALFKKLAARVSRKVAKAKQIKPQAKRNGLRYWLYRRHSLCLLLNIIIDSPE